jgi:hypothetical protein
LWVIFGSGSGSGNTLLKPPNAGFVAAAAPKLKPLDENASVVLLGFVAAAAPKLKPPNAGCADDATAEEDALDPKPPTAGFVAADVPKLKPLDENASVVLPGAATPGSLNANGERF